MQNGTSMMRAKLRASRGFARTRRADEQDIGFFQLDAIARRAVFDNRLALVVVVNRDREQAFGALLTDDVLAQNIENLARFGQTAQDADGHIVLDDFGMAFFGENVVAKFNAFVADINARARDQVVDLFAALATKGAPQIVAVFAKHCHQLKIPLFACKG